MNDLDMFVGAVLSLRAVCRNLITRDAELQVLVGVDLTVHTHEMVAVTGPSGSGKSTLCSVAASWEQPDAGVVDHHGVTSVFVPQRSVVFDELDVAANLRLAAGRRGTIHSRLLDQTAAALSITHLLDRPSSMASIGERQRICLARALLARPGLLIADEPTAHQDAASAGLVMAALAQHRDHGAVLIATHDSNALATCDRVLELHAGHLTDITTRGDRTAPR